MNNTPTAEEYINKFNLQGEEGTLSKKNLIWMLEDYANLKTKFHVKAALEAASKIKPIEDCYRGRFHGCMIDKESILNAYPEDLY